MAIDKQVDDLIVKLVQNKNIKEQFDLLEILKDYGFNIAQATLSRKLKKLNIVIACASVRCLTLSAQALSSPLLRFAVYKTDRTHSLREWET